MPQAKFKALVLLAHPSLDHSQVNLAMKDAITGINGVTVHDLYETYPEFYVDVKTEQALLLEQDLIVFQHPFYWYSVTPLLKLWQDVVLEYGFAYGSEGNALRGKDFWQVISAGGRDAAYNREGYNYYTMEELLTPVRATSNLCGMNYQPPLIIHNSYNLTEAEIIQHASVFRETLSLYTVQGAACFKQEGK